MKRPTMLVKAVLQDAALDLDLSVERDSQRIESRCEHEGFSFLTITLPLLDDALLQGLESGTFTCPTSFSRHGKLPRFLGGFFQRVFTLDGKLLDNACPKTVFWIRQVCRFFKKPKTECSPARNRKAIQHFVDVEGDLRQMTSQVERKDIILDKISRTIWTQVFPELDSTELVCHHGPGFTADRLLSNERNRIRYWNQRSEHLYPSDLHAYPNYGVAAAVCGTGGETEGIEGVEYLKVRDELPVRVVFVPKTLTAPRVIAMEPSHVQFIQQGLKDFVYEKLERHPLTKHSIRFTRQDVNQRRAYSSSVDRRLATLDLKDASDRVHLHLVQRIFKNSGLLEYLEDARSAHATLPDGRNIVLFKYASMGSALCFPVEAMVFYTLIQSAMHQLDGRRPSTASIKDYSRMIDIYGDDIVVPVKYTDVVVRYLESYALKVNVNKSFRLGNFRESCGSDYYKGYWVSPIYARTVPSDNLRHWGAEDVMSWNATADLCYQRGLWRTAQTIRTLLARVVRRTIPKTRKLGSGVVHFSYLFTTDLSWDAKLQCWKQKRLHYDPVKRKDSIDGNELACLNKWGQTVHARESALARGNPPRYRNTSFGYARDLEIRQALADFGGRTKSPVESLGACLSDSCVRRVQDLHGQWEPEIPALQPVACTCDAVGVGILPSRDGSKQLSSDDCLTECLNDPLYYLSGDTSGIDFQSSTNRGVFKSKRRWVSLTS